MRGLHGLTLDDVPELVQDQSADEPRSLRSDTSGVEIDQQDRGALEQRLQPELRLCLSEQSADTRPAADDPELVPDGCHDLGSFGDAEAVEPGCPRAEGQWIADLSQDRATK